MKENQSLAMVRRNKKRLLSCLFVHCLRRLGRSQVKRARATSQPCDRQTHNGHIAMQTIFPYQFLRSSIDQLPASPAIVSTCHGSRWTFPEMPRLLQGAGVFSFIVSELFWV
jgi:hypothetical protein